MCVGGGGGGESGWAELFWLLGDWHAKLNYNLCTTCLYYSYPVQILSCIPIHYSASLFFFAHPNPFC